MLFFEISSPGSFLDAFVPAVAGAFIGGGFVILALILQQRAQEGAAVRALILEMLHNGVMLSSWTRAAADLATVPKFPILNHSVFDQQLPLIAKHLDFADLVAVLQAYTTLFIHAPGFASLEGKTISGENIHHSKNAAEKFVAHARALSKRFLTRKEQKFAESFFAGMKPKSPAQAIAP